MGTIRFNIPYPPTKKGKSAFCRRFGLNAYYSGKHWAQRKKDADELHALTLAALKQARVRRGMGQHRKAQHDHQNRAGLHHLCMGRRAGH